jgi:predicted NBD/HSP70 family sugar kinase
MPSVDPWIGPRGSAAQRLLQIMRDRAASGPLTRPEAARLTGMSLSGIRPLVTALIEEGQLVEEPARRRPDQGRGRPGSVLVPVVPDGIVLGLDFGHAHVSVAVADLNGEHLVHERRAVDVDRHADDALDAAADLAGRVLRRERHPVSAVAHVVAGVPGPVGRDGRMRSSTIVASWWELQIADEIARRLRVDPAAVDVENDAHLGALGEHRAGAAAGCSDFVYVKASHGLGIGLVLGGEVYRGAKGLAGEIGHAVVEPDGELCRCGSRGCLETVVSIERVRQQVSFVSGSAQPDLMTAAAQHPAARRIVLEAGRTLGRALADVCNLLDPDRVVVGGELAAAGPPLVEGVAESIRRYAQPAVGDTEVVLAALGERAQVAGATALAGARARAELWSTR